MAGVLPQSLAVRPRIYYGWFVVAASFAVMATLGETFFAFGVFFKPLEGEFDWSRTVTSSAFTTFLVGYAISAVASGRLVDRYPPRLILLSSAFLAGLGISLCRLVGTIDQLRLFLFIGGLGGGASMAVPVATVQRWFYNRRHAGIALAIITCGVGVGGLIFAPLINNLILTQGWREAFLTVGIIFAAIIVLASFVIKQCPKRPEDIPQRERLLKTSTSGWTTRKALANPGYVSIIFITVVGMVAFHTVSIHLVPYATDLGFSATASAAALGLVSGFSVPGRLTSGFISSRIGWQRAWALAYFGLVASMVWLLFLRDVWTLYGFVVLYGASVGVRVVAQMGIVGEFFGMRSLGELLGIVSAISNLVGAMAPYIAGFIFDTTGSYSVAFITVAVALMAGGIMALVMKRPPPIPE